MDSAVNLKMTTYIILKTESEIVADGNGDSLSPTQSVTLVDLNSYHCNYTLSLVTLLSVSTMMYSSCTVQYTQNRILEYRGK